MEGLVEYDLTYLSLGAGAQSSALLAMSALGRHGVPRIDAAIFADTQAEPKYVYDYLDILEEWVKPHGIPIYRESLGSLWYDTVNGLRGNVAVRGTLRRVLIPAWTRGRDGREAPLTRKCTKEYKVEVVQRKARNLLGFAKGERIAGKKMARALIGISLDEVIRAKPSQEAWIDKSFPLIDAGLRREDCVRFLREIGLPTPQKSACVF